jgi:hypothetical protein
VIFYVKFLGPGVYGGAAHNVRSGLSKSGERLNGPTNPHVVILGRQGVCAFMMTEFGNDLRAGTESCE